MLLSISHICLTISQKVPVRKSSPYFQIIRHRFFVQIAVNSIQEAYQQGMVTSLMTLTFLTVFVLTLSREHVIVIHKFFNIKIVNLFQMIKFSS